jgi:hypothetical protein
MTSLDLAAAVVDLAVRAVRNDLVVGAQCQILGFGEAREAPFVRHDHTLATGELVPTHELVLYLSANGAFNNNNNIVIKQ